jgi:hypothetical protein
MTAGAYLPDRRRAQPLCLRCLKKERGYTDIATKRPCGIPSDVFIATAHQMLVHVATHSWAHSASLHLSIMRDSPVDLVPTSAKVISVEALLLYINWEPVVSLGTLSPDIGRNGLGGSETTSDHQLLEPLAYHAVSTDRAPFPHLNSI